MSKSVSRFFSSFSSPGLLGAGPGCDWSAGLSSVRGLAADFLCDAEPGTSSPSASLPYLGSSGVFVKVDSWLFRALWIGMPKRLGACNSGDINENKILLSQEEVQSTAFAVGQLTFWGCQSGNPKSSLFLWASCGEQVSF